MDSLAGEVRLARVIRKRHGCRDTIQSHPVGWLIHHRHSSRENVQSEINGQIHKIIIIYNHTYIHTYIYTYIHAYILLGERERAHLVVQLGRAVCI